MKVAIHLFDGVSLFHAAAPQLVFREAAELSANPTDWRVSLWSQTGAAVCTEEGHRLDGLCGPEATTDADIVIICSWPWSAPPVDPDLQTLLLTAHRRGAVIAGLCLGAIAVAETGLLAGRSAVTHWMATDILIERGRCGTVDDSALYIDHGDVITSAGTAASIDACLHLLREHAGADVATRVARRLVVAPHREGNQAQYIERPVAITEPDVSIRHLIDWALNHLAEDLGVDNLAKHAQMSRRTFIRHFSRATGTTPAQWVTQQRVEHARALLENTDWTLPHIARDCGFASAVTLRQNFVHHYSVSPSSYRNRFHTQ